MSTTSAKLYPGGKKWDKKCSTQFVVLVADMLKQNGPILSIRMTKIETLSQLLPENELKDALKKVPKGETPLWQYWEEFLEDFLDEDGSRHTVKAVRSFLAHLIRHTPAVSIEYCNNSRNVTKLLKQMKSERGFKNTTRNKYKNVLNTYFIWLEDMEYIEENKIRKVRKSKEESVEVYSLTGKQIEEIFFYIYESDQTPFVKKRGMLMFNIFRATGARQCEVLALKPSDIYFQPRTGKHPATWVIRLHRAKQKGSIDHLPIPQWVADSYLDFMEIRNKTRANEEFLFVSQCKRDTGLTDKGVTYFLKQLESVLGFKITSRSFRTHVATRLMEEGKGIQDIAFYLGHKRISTTLRYIRKTPLMHRACADVMSDQINPDLLAVKNYVPGMAN